MTKALFKWIDDRFQIQDLVEFLRHKQVPRHGKSLWYYFGGISLFFFLIQVVSGILLLLYYKPGEDSAYEAVQFITAEVEFGWLVRSVHTWAANLMILSAFIHMFSVLFTRAFVKPRELTWITGTLLLFVGLGFGFSGYLLPWNELAFFATKVGTDIVGAIPFIGDSALQLLRGGEDVTGATLSRFFAIHVAVMPAIFTLLLSVHLIMVQRQGMSEPENWKKLPEGDKRYMPFFPHFLLRDLLIWIVALNVLALLAILWPSELGLKADPFLPAPAGIMPEWYFIFMFQTLKLIPAHVLFMEGELLGIFGFGLGAIVWMLLPLWIGHKVRSSTVSLLGILVIIYIVGMTIWGFLV
ncbi:MAG: cytochrome b N-terminal domain-containing protein [Candidatus Delongbacteria bacterium]|nr:cytochrome b N-terminal domain-containing protein [Candidatus Delongbacteria bacterium]